MDAQRDLENLIRLVGGLYNPEIACLVRKELHNILDRWGNNIPLTNYDIWQSIAFLLILAGEVDIATRVIGSVARSGEFPHMERALSLLKDGKLVAAAYNVRTAECYNHEMRKGADFAPPPVVTNEILALPSEARLLELGCGTGLTGGFLRQAGFPGRMTGVDLVAEMVCAIPDGLYDELAVGDACAWMKEDHRSWHAVISLGVFIHFPEYVARQFIHLAAQRLTVGGLLAFNASEVETRMVNALPLAKASVIFDEAGLEVEAIKRDEERTTYLCRKVMAAN